MSHLLSLFLNRSFASSGKQLKGEDAPLASQLNSWLESHPGWEVVEYTDDEDEEYDDDLDEDGSRDGGNCEFCNLPFSFFL